MASSKLVFKDPIPMRNRVNNTPPKPVVIEIKRSMSKPAVSDAPSILTTFPPEIRNAIYTILFKRDEPIEIVDYETQREEPPWLMDYASEYEYGFHDSESEAKAEFNAAQLEATDFMNVRTHDIYKATAMLRACRQCYHEAVGILYGHNTFLFTTPAHQHNLNMDQVENAVKFLRSVGSQLAMTTRIEIDVGRVCPSFCREGETTDWLPLIHSIWSRPLNSPQIYFVDTGREFCDKLHNSFDYRHNEKFCATKMNNILNAIAHQDLLSIYRYGRFERLLQGIWIEDCYGDSSDMCTAVVNGAEDSLPLYLRFKTNESGCTFELLDNSWDATLHDITYPIFERILDYAVASDGTTVIDLDTRSVQNYNQILSRICHRSRSYFQSNYTSLLETVLRMESQATCTTFDGFARLQDWMRGPYGWMLKRNHFEYGRGNFAPTLALCFVRTQATSHSDLRIGITALLQLTLDFDPCTKLRFSVISPGHNLPDAIDCEVQLQCLRRKCFILLSEIVRCAPWRADKEVPEIWIDGTGALLEATSRRESISRPNLRVTPSLDFPSEPEDILACGQLHKTKLIEMMELELRKIAISPYRHPSLAEAGSGSILAFWKMLQAVDWREV